MTGKLLSEKRVLSSVNNLSLRLPVEEVYQLLGDSGLYKNNTVIEVFSFITTCQHVHHTHGVLLFNCQKRFESYYEFVKIILVNTVLSFLLDTKVH
jgi:hypothetical protein